MGLGGLPVDGGVLTGHTKTPTASLGGLAAGALVLAGVVSASVDAEAPAVPPPITVWQPLTIRAHPEPTMRTPTPPIILEPVLVAPSAPPRIVVTQPAAKVETKAPRKKVPPVSGRAISGVATWYCEPGVSVCTHGYSSGGAYAAAGPELRRALGHWRGRYVYVNGVRVQLVDWCACGGNHIIDVYHATWLRIPHPSRATIRW